MTDLEFINEHIKEIQTSIKTFELDYKLYHREGDKRDAEKLKQILHHLQQIKAELEAWEVVKNIVEIKRTEVFPHVLRIKQGKGALTLEEFRVLKNLIRVGDK